MYLLTDNIILCVENPKIPQKSFTELINKFSKVAGYKVNTQKSVAFLYTNNEQSEKKIKVRISCTTASKGIKYWEFPGGPVVRTQRFHFGDPGPIPGGGTKIPQAEWCSQKIKIKRIKYLGINLTKEVKDLHNENCNSFLKRN